MARNASLHLKIKTLAISIAVMFLLSALLVLRARKFFYGITIWGILLWPFNLQSMHGGASAADLFAIALPIAMAIWGFVSKWVHAPCLIMWACIVWFILGYSVAFVGV